VMGLCASLLLPDKAFVPKAPMELSCRASIGHVPLLVIGLRASLLEQLRKETKNELVPKWLNG
jgi:hypothetical protein